MSSFLNSSAKLYPSNWRVFRCNFIYEHSFFVVVVGLLPSVLVESTEKTIKIRLYCTFTARQWDIRGPSLKYKQSKFSFRVRKSSWNCKTWQFSRIFFIGYDTDQFLIHTRFTGQFELFLKIRKLQMKVYRVELFLTDTIILRESIWTRKLQRSDSLIDFYWRLLFSWAIWNFISLLKSAISKVHTPGRITNKWKLERWLPEDGVIDLLVRRFQVSFLPRWWTLVNWWKQK